MSDVCKAFFQSLARGFVDLGIGQSAVINFRCQIWRAGLLVTTTHPQISLTSQPRCRWGLYHGLEILQCLGTGTLRFFSVGHVQRDQGSHDNGLIVAKQSASGLLVGL